MAQEHEPQKIIAITGAGGIGTAIARKVCHGRKILLADFSSSALDRVTKALGSEGYDVEAHLIDVSDHSSVVAFAQIAAQAGKLEAVVHAAGLSPAQAESSKIMAVDLLGTANVIDAFYEVATPGLAVVCVASMAGYMGGVLPQEFERHLATAPLGKLLEHDDVDKATRDTAYTIAKRGNILRVQAVAGLWGRKGARINSVSPGVIMTPMLEDELDGPMKIRIDHTVNQSAVGKMGGPEDVANVVDFLLNPASSFITGADFLVDGGAVAGHTWGEKAQTS